VDPWTSRLETTTEALVLTANNLISRTDFVKIIGDMLRAAGEGLRPAARHGVYRRGGRGGKDPDQSPPVRPMRLPGATGPIQLPEDVRRSGSSLGPPDDQRRRDGPDPYLLYIDPERYSAIVSPEVKKSIGRIVGRINEHPRGRGPDLMMGPGRWGAATSNSA